MAVIIIRRIYKTDRHCCTKPFIVNDVCPIDQLTSLVCSAYGHAGHELLDVLVKIFALRGSKLQRLTGQFKFKIRICFAKIPSSLCAQIPTRNFTLLLFKTTDNRYCAFSLMKAALIFSLSKLTFNFQD